MVRIRRLLRLGWPSAAQMTLEVGVFAVVTAFAGRLEPHLLAAHQIVLNTVGLTFMVTYGLSSAGAIRVGHAVGRRDPTSARYSGWVALGIGAVFMGVAAVGFLTVPEAILRIFTSDARVIVTGVLLLSVGLGVPAFWMVCRPLPPASCEDSVTRGRRCCVIWPDTGVLDFRSATPSASGGGGVWSACGLVCRWA